MGRIGLIGPNRSATVHHVKPRLGGVAIGKLTAQMLNEPEELSGRTVDLDQATVDRLREHRDRQQLDKAATQRLEDSGFVFTREDGSALNPSTLTRSFRWIVARSELPRIRLHDLRHTHASIAVKAGLPIGVVSERLGHASPEFTLHRYSHVMPGMYGSGWWRDRI